MVTLEEQLHWESESCRIGRLAVKSRLDNSIDKMRVEETPIQNAVLRRYLMGVSSMLSKEISNDLGKAGRYKPHARLLRDLDPDAVSLIALTTTLNMCMQSDETADYITPLTAVASKIGATLHNELLLSIFEDIEPILFHALQNDLRNRLTKSQKHKVAVFRNQAKANGIELPEWTPEDRIKVGSFMLGLLATPDDSGESFIDIFKSVFKNGNRVKTVLAVQLGSNISYAIGDLLGRLLDRAHLNRPSLLKPKDWNSVGLDGGYYGDMRKIVPRFMKSDGVHYDKVLEQHPDLSTTVKALNTLQSVEWEINPFIHNLVTEMRNRGVSLDGVFEYQTAHERTRPTRPEFLDGVDDVATLSEAKQDIFNEWKANTRDWHTENRRIGRKELILNSMAASSRELIKKEKFYYVWQVDTRYRAYALAGYISPQGSDLGKAYLRSHKSAHMYGDEVALWYFKLSLASKYGIDKLKADECVKWVDDNTATIIDVMKDPASKDSLYWWGQADSPFCFIAMCEEYVRFLENPKLFRTKIPVSIDGSCNGLQNYSAIWRDEVGGYYTNLIQSESGVPNDIYQRVADVAYEDLKSMPDEPLKQLWLAHGFPRALAKKPVMTKVYNSKFTSCVKSVTNYCKDNNLFPDKEYEAGMYAGRLIWDAIGKVVVKAIEAMGWLSKCATKILADDDTIVWNTPTGAVVVQEYYKYRQMRVRILLNGRVHRVAVQGKYGEGDTPNKINHRNAFPPNFIHSVDGSHMALVTCRCASDMGDGVFLQMIHDEFGTLAPNAAKLHKITQEEFVNMHTLFTMDYALNRYTDLPEIPSSGVLDINAVLQSFNFFR